MKGEKYFRYNQAPFMSNVLCKAIMTHSRLLNKCKKSNSIENQWV